MMVMIGFEKTFAIESDGIFFRALNTGIDLFNLSEDSFFYLSRMTVKLNQFLGLTLLGLWLYFGFGWLAGIRSVQTILLVVLYDFEKTLDVIKLILGLSCQFQLQDVELLLNQLG